MTMEVLEQRVKQLEKDQEKYVLREVFDIFKEELVYIRHIANQNKYTNMKIVGALILFKIVYAPFIFMVLQGWLTE